MEQRFSIHIWQCLVEIILGRPGNQLRPKSVRNRMTERFIMQCRPRAFTIGQIKECLIVHFTAQTGSYVNVYLQYYLELFF